MFVAVLFLLPTFTKRAYLQPYRCENGSVSAFYSYRSGFNQYNVGVVPSEFNLLTNLGALHVTADYGGFNSVLGTLPYLGALTNLESLVLWGVSLAVDSARCAN